MTPELRLREAERKASLSCIRKFRCEGIRCMIRSTQIILEPTMQAIPLIQVIIQPLVSLGSTILPRFVYFWSFLPIGGYGQGVRISEESD